MAAEYVSAKNEPWEEKIICESVDGKQNGIVRAGGGDELVGFCGILGGVDVIAIFAAEGGDVVGDVAVGVEDVLAFAFVVGGVAELHVGGEGGGDGEEGVGFAGGGDAGVEVG